MRRFWCCAAAGGAILLAFAATAAGGPGRCVHYQVTYTDGTSRDLSTVPGTDKGITRVLRIARIEQGSRGYEVLSTGPQPLTLVSRGQTYKTDLAWNGRAWVAPSNDARGVVAPKPAPPAGAGDAAQAEAMRLKAELMELAAMLLESSEALAKAERDLEGKQAAAVARARKEVLTCVRNVLAGARKIGGPGAGPKRPPRAAGQVTLRAGPAPKQGAGIAKPIGKVASLPHRVQVWKLPAGTGRRSYRVSAGHPEAGQDAGFYYVAYADTTGDGRPDRLLARSPFARADRAGQWSQWQFTTEAGSVFVGTAWERPKAVHYHTEAVRIDDNWRGLSSEAYVSVDAWGLPVRRWGPCWGNIRVWAAQP